MIQDSSPKTPRPSPLFAAACFALGGSLVLNYFAGKYAAEHGSGQPSLTDDLLLGVLPQYNVDGLFVWGFAAMIGVAAVGCWLERERAAYVAWMYALLISLRSGFIILTPMGAPPGSARPSGDWLFEMFGQWLTLGNDLFFSSHTALPFLGFLVFRHPVIRAAMLALSIVLAGCTLVGRYHYSIDVAAAYFITYALVAGHDSILRRWRPADDHHLAAGQ